MDDATKGIDDQIEALETYRDAWNEIPDEWEKAQNILLAQQILGADWENQILTGRMDVLEEFKNNYIAAQQAMADAAWKSANEQIKAAKEAAKGAGGTEGSSNFDTLGELSNNGWHFQGKTYSNKDEAYAAQQKYVQTTIDQLLKAGMPVSEQGAKVAYLYKKFPVEYYHNGVVGGYVGDSASDDKRLKVLTDAGLGKLNLKDNEVPTILKKKELVFNEEQQKNLFNSLVNNPINWNIPIPKYDIPQISQSKNQSITIGDIHLHEVQNVSDFAKALQKHLPNISVQYNGRH